MSQHPAIIQTQLWVNDVIVKYNFCPFARAEVASNKIQYTLCEQNTAEDAVMSMLDGCFELEQHPEIETTLLIYPEGFSDFDDFLALVDLANVMLAVQGFEGTYQLANFHPDYVFADSEPDDAANYTNRSPYPTLHLIREHSMSMALDDYDQPESIPEHNIKLARRKGRDFWQQLLENCINKPTKQ
ncbi:hypothetical protein PULV_a1910 [Pseudoalteromonas ulvae UL12]|uniref:DUF1415 domain-containing protein n=1 Tax=Pseudoalteromonas ulvae TaxID=107327 RepID=A0A244CR88_PSEDV|nr:DUF1415 domain-containing protein [Pseudoalteromonas ulvae]MBE0365161.1 hypothetical protein [Pseudoalteromonas ulvae UL12]OUL57709.1 hypothetical protein B1199_11660 [Pseudoalteromonas ulvae]